MSKHAIMNYIYNYDYFYKNSSINYRGMLKYTDNKIKMKYNNEIFTFEINEEKDIYFLRTLDTNNDCIVFGVDLSSSTININNINADVIEPCFQAIINKKGTYLLELAIKFAKKLYQENKIKINRITLTDNSIKHCKNQKNKRVIFSDLRQIISGDTFYGKHGFEPINEINKKQYNKNKKVLQKILLKDIKFKKYILEFNETYKKNDISLINYIDDNPNMKISNLFEYLSKSFENNCNLMDFLMKKIYRKYNLESMHGVMYEMQLDVNK